MDGAEVGQWEAVAREVLDATGIEAPVDAFQLARACQLTCVAADHHGGAWLDLDARIIRYNPRARLVRQHGSVAHEVAHYVLGEDDSESAARYTAGALMLPRRTFDRQLEQTAWDLEQLRELHPNASAQLLARRISELRDAVVTVFDNGRVRERIASPWLRAPRRLTPVERELADAALATGRVQRAGDLFAAYPFFDGSFRRVIVVAEAQQLHLQLTHDRG